MDFLANTFLLTAICVVLSFLVCQFYQKKVNSQSTNDDPNNDDVVQKPVNYLQCGLISLLVGVMVFGSVSVVKFVLGKQEKSSMNALMFETGNPKF